MKYYSKKIIQDYIEAHKDRLTYVEVGMEEDWFWTSEEVWDMETGYHLSASSDDKIQVAGISSSYWATPVMKVHYKDEEEAHIIPCYASDNKTRDGSEIAAMKAFAAATGGMDSVYETI